MLFRSVSQSRYAVDQSNVLDDAGLPYVYGASKILDMLGYGSFLASNNTAKAVITKAYLGKDSVSDTSNPLVYSASQTVNLLPYWLIRKSIMISSLSLSGKNTWLMLTMSIIGTVNHS